MRFSIVTSRPHVVCMSSSLNEVFLAHHAIFSGNEMYKRIMASRGTYLQTSGVLFSILSTENSILKFKMKGRNTDKFLSGSKMENHGV